MTIASMQLDPNATSYTDNQIVGKVNTATANITRASSVSAAARPIEDLEVTNAKIATAAGIAKSKLASLEIVNADVATGAAISADKTADGTTNKVFSATKDTKLTGIETGATADQTGDEMVTSINSGSGALTRASVLSQNDLNIVKTAPVTGEFKIKNIHRDATGKLDVEYDDVAV